MKTFKKMFYGKSRKHVYENKKQEAHVLVNNQKTWCFLKICFNYFFKDCFKNNRINMKNN